MTDTFIPDPASPNPYWAQLVVHRNPGIDLNAAGQAWKDGIANGIPDGSHQMVTYIEARLGVNSGATVRLNKEQREAARFSNIDEPTYAKQLMRLNDLKSNGHIQT
jgi:hypothetical protein